MLFRSDNIDILGWLLLNTAIDVNERDKEGRTALFLDYDENLDTNVGCEVIKLLLRDGADPTIRDLGGKTAYDYAVEQNAWEYAELLKVEE